MKSFLLPLCLVLLPLFAWAQNVGIGTISPNPKAMLHIQSNHSGLLVPRLTAGQRASMNANGLADAGILVFDSTDNYFYYFDAAQNNWLTLPDKDWMIVGNDQYSGVAGNVGIGVAAPTAKLHTNGSVRMQGLGVGNDTLVLISDANGNLSQRPLPLNVWDGDDVGVQLIGGGTGISVVGAGNAVTVHANVSNGLYINAAANEIRLGGNLVENTTVTTNSFDLLLNRTTAAGKIELQHNGNPALTLAPGGNIGIQQSNPQAQAILDIFATDKGVLLPRMTTAQRNAIAAPPLGLIVYNIEDSVAQHYNGSCWLPMYLDDCNACDFTLTLSDTLGIINKTTVDSVQTTLTVTQTAGSTAPINLYYLQNLPTGATISLNTYVIVGTGTATLTVKADVFATPGIYPIAIQAMCGTTLKMKVFYVQIDSCYKIFINNSFTDYDLQVINNLPTNVPICVITTIQPTGKLYGNNAPAFTTGNIHPQSQVGIINLGEVYGRGGNGADLANFANFNLNNPGAPGFPGNHALNMTVKAHLINNGFIFGGGGGGGSIGWAQTIGLPFPFPSLSIGLGVGGGGGAPNGLGGSVPSGSFAIGLIDAGDNATGGLNGAGGSGGVINVPISIPLGPVTVSVIPNAYGGNGGGYGIAGTNGTMNVNVCATLPLIGQLCFGPFPNPPYPNTTAPGGAAGYAIKRNGNLLIGLQDGYYQVFQIRGQVGL